MATLNSGQVIGADGQFISLESAERYLGLPDENGKVLASNTDGTRFWIASAGAQGSPGPQGAQGVQGSSGVGSQGAQGVQGSPGPQGAQGVQGSSGVGSQGSPGAQGVQGSPGLQGAQGVQGSSGVGSQGSAGAQGVQGAVGAQGVQGAVGAQGVQGAQGAQGAQGTASNVPGPQGAQGAQGSAGTSVTIVGSVPTVTSSPPHITLLSGGDTGQSWDPPQAGYGVIETSSGDLWVYDGSFWNNVGTIVGPQGPQGVQGSEGAQGTASNVPGPQGVQGAVGAQGAQGVQGSSGVGSQGSPGAQGVQGSPGPQGAQGVQGSSGVGSQGSPGAQGVQGSAGPQGAQGVQGSSGVGSQGSPGAQGVQGAVGAQGAQGVQGSSGVGSQGSPGAQGARGPDGGTGPQGAQGSAGAQGRQGSAGAQGVQGSPGVGAQGAPGPSTQINASAVTSGVYYPVFVTGTGDQTPRIRMAATALSYDATNNILTVPTVSGNATTASSTPYWYNNGMGESEIKVGNADNASFTQYNMIIRSWWGIGFRDYTDSATVKLYIDCRTGNLASSGTISAADINSTSDIKLKTNITTLTDSLDTIQNLRGVRFNWKESGRPSLGVIAQEIESVVPELVSEDNDGTKSVAYGNITALLIEAIKELKERVEVLEQNSKY